MEDQVTYNANTTQAQAADKRKRKRVSTYKARVEFTFHFDNEDSAQEQIEKRKKLEALAKELGAVEVTGSGAYGSTMVDAK